MCRISTQVVSSTSNGGKESDDSVEMKDVLSSSLVSNDQHPVQNKKIYSKSSVKWKRNLPDVPLFEYKDKGKIAK